MADRRSFKTDVSFLEKISMGAIGTQRVFDHLAQQGHTPLELERGSKSYKIWKQIKIKRIRVPDILCLRCGHRVESRAKKVLEISMSHSQADQDRGWDAGLEDTDFVALIVCEKSGERPIDWRAEELVQYIPVANLRLAQKKGQAIIIQAKGAQEGFEVRIVWPASIARSAGVIEQINSRMIYYRRPESKRKNYSRLVIAKTQLTPLVKVGESVVTNQILAAVVPVMRQFPCSTITNEDYYIGRLGSASLSQRYAAAKALSGFHSEKVLKALIEKVSNQEEHIYIRLEAASSLARSGEEIGWNFLGQCLTAEYLQNRLEAVIILGEIVTERSCEILSQVLLDERQHPEIRAGAAWALGELHNKNALGVLVDSFTAVDEEIRIEAARALLKLAARFTPEILEKFFGTAAEKRAGIAWALGKSANFQLDDLLKLLVDEDARQWVAYIIGSQDQQKYVNEIEKLKASDPEIYFAVTVLWKIMTSWIYGLEEY